MKREILSMKPSDRFDHTKEMAEYVESLEAHAQKHYRGSHARMLLDFVVDELEGEDELDRGFQDYLLGKILKQVTGESVDQATYHELLHAIQTKKDHPFATILKFDNADKRLLAIRVQELSSFSEFRMRVEETLRSTLTPIHREHAQEIIKNPHTNSLGEGGFERVKKIQEATMRMLQNADSIDEEIFQRILEVYNQKIIEYIQRVCLRCSTQQ